MAVRKTWKNDWLTFVQQLVQCVTEGVDEDTVRGTFAGAAINWTGMYFRKRIRSTSNNVTIMMGESPQLICGREVIIGPVVLPLSSEQMAAWNALEFGQIVNFVPVLTNSPKQIFPSIRWSGSNRLVFSLSFSGGTLRGVADDHEIGHVKWRNLREKLTKRRNGAGSSQSDFDNLADNPENDLPSAPSPNTPLLRPPTKAEKVRIDFDVLEEKLDLVVPNVYRMFIEAAVAKNCNLPLYGIYHTTETIIKANTTLRRHLADADPSWQNHYLDIGLGDGVGNYFFLHATDEEDDRVELWAHDPAGIEKVSSAIKFLKQVLGELECGFTGPNHDRFQGNGPFAE